MHHFATALWLCVAGNICSFSFMGGKSAVRKRVGQTMLVLDFFVI